MMQSQQYILSKNLIALNDGSGCVLRGQAVRELKLNILKGVPLVIKAG